MRIPDLELLWWEGCPSTERALSELACALTEVSLDGAEVRMREIRTDSDALQAGFTGSPTILIDGIDCLAAASDQVDDPVGPVGLNCRIYRRRDGRISPTPDPDDLREALRRAAARVEVSQ